MKQLMATTAQHQQKTDSELQNIRNQMSQMQSMQSQMNQMSITINRLKSQVHGKLPSQPELNLKNINAMTLRSGKEVQGPELVVPKDKDKEKIENEFEKESSNGKNPVVLSDPFVEVKTHSPHFS